MKKKKPKVLALTLMSVLAFSGSAFAGDYLEAHQANPKNIKVIRNAVYGQASYNSLLSDCAFGIWNNATSAINFKDSTSGDNILVKAVSKDVSWTGLTTSYRSGSHITKSTIELNHEKIKNTTTAQQKNTILHELGHAIGLAHQDSKASLMYPYQTSIDYIPSEDVSRLNYLYNNIHAKE